MGWSTPTTTFDGTIWYFSYTMETHWTYAWRSLVEKKIFFDKITAVSENLDNFSLIRCLYMHRWCLQSWADQLLPQLLMEQFDTLPIQCRHIEHMHEGVWLRKNIFLQNDSCENLDNFSLIRHDSCANLDNFSLIRLLYIHRWCLHGPINSYYSFWWNNLILCQYNVDTLNICMK